jgi:hypothetical protein
MSRSLGEYSNKSATLSVHSGFYNFASDFVRVSLELRLYIPPEVFREIIRKFGNLVWVSPALVKTLAIRLISLPNSQSPSGKNRFTRLVVFRFLKKIEYTRVPPNVFSKFCPQDNPNLGQFSYVISNRFVPFLHGNMSLSLTQIFEILCLLIYHLKTARSKMQDYSEMLNVGGRFDDDGYFSNEFCSDDEDCCSSNRPSIEHREFMFAKEAITHIDHFLEYVEPAIPNCQRIFERYMQEMLSIFPRMLVK